MLKSESISTSKNKHRTTNTVNNHIGTTHWVFWVLQCLAPQHLQLCDSVQSSRKGSLTDTHSYLHFWKGKLTGYIRASRSPKTAHIVKFNVSIHFNSLYLPKWAASCTAVASKYQLRQLIMLQYSTQKITLIVASNNFEKRVQWYPITAAVRRF